jgi:23S rRNA pseudouridine1911/1915/1917 synthase
MKHRANRGDPERGGRTIAVSRAEAGQSVAALLHRHLAVSWSVARRLVAQGKVRLGHALCRNAEQRLKAGQRVVVHRDERGKQDNRSTPAAPAAPPKRRKPGERPTDGAWRKYHGPMPAIVHVDADVVVVDKPAGLTTMRHAEEAAEFGSRGRRFLPPTLADLLPELLPADRHGRTPRVRAVHRLDRDTSGLVVFARTAEAERHLGRQFRAHSLGRRYLAIVRGHAEPGRVESFFVVDRGDARRGSSPTTGEGKRAVTHIGVIESIGAFTLVECRLETGRTHQVRIHLGERGTPICGEHVYDRPIHGTPLPDGSGAKRLALHAADLAFDHPRSGERLSFHAPLPEDMRELVKRLRK